MRMSPALECSFAGRRSARLGHGEHFFHYCLLPANPGKPGNVFYIIVCEFGGKGEIFFLLLGEISGGRGKESNYSPTELPGGNGEGGNVLLSRRVHSNALAQSNASNMPWASLAA